MKDKISYKFLELKIDIKKYKSKYTLIGFLINRTLFLIMIINNLYLKIILQNISPNHAMFDLIFISFFFLLLISLNIFVSSFLTFYKNKNFHKIIITMQIHGSKSTKHHQTNKSQKKLGLFLVGIFGFRTKSSKIKLENTG